MVETKKEPWAIFQKCNDHINFFFYFGIIVGVSLYILGRMKKEKHKLLLPMIPSNASVALVMK